MFTWQISVQTETVHIPFWRGEKKLIKPKVFSEQRISINSVGSPQELYLQGEHKTWYATILCLSNYGQLRIRVPQGMPEVFLANGERIPRFLHDWEQIAPQARIDDFVSEVLTEELRIYQDPDECHAYKLSVTKILRNQPLVPIPGTRMKPNDAYITIEKVDYGEDRYLVAANVGNLDILLGEKREEFARDEWYQAILELGELPMNDWLVTAEQVPCSTIH